MMAACKLAPKDGMARMKQQAQWLEREHPDVAASRLEGLHEIFTVNALGLPPTLMRCLCTTKLIENPNGIVRRTSCGRRRATRFSRRQQGAALVGSRLPRSREIVSEKSRASRTSGSSRLS